MFKKFQFFITAMLVASAVTAISGNISCKEFHSGSLLQNQNTESLLYCDFGFDTNKKHV